MSHIQNLQSNQSGNQSWVKETDNASVSESVTHLTISDGKSGELSVPKELLPFARDIMEKLEPGSSQFMVDGFQETPGNQIKGRHLATLENVVGMLKGVVGRDTTTAMMAISTVRSEILNDVVKSSVEDMQLRNQEISRLTDLLQEVRAKGPDKDENGAEFKEPLSGQALRLLVENGWDTKIRIGAHENRYMGMEYQTIKTVEAGTGQGQLTKDTLGFATLAKDEWELSDAEVRDNRFNSNNPLAYNKDRHQDLTWVDEMKDLSNLAKDDDLPSFFREDVQTQLDSNPVSRDYLHLATSEGRRYAYAALANAKELHEKLLDENDDRINYESYAPSIYKTKQIVQMAAEQGHELNPNSFYSVRFKAGDPSQLEITELEAKASLVGDKSHAQLTTLIKSEIDDLSSSSQLDMVKLQGLINKKNQSVELMTTIQQKDSSLMDKLIGGMAR